MTWRDTALSRKRWADDHRSRPAAALPPALAAPVAGSKPRRDSDALGAWISPIASLPWRTEARRERRTDARLHVLTQPGLDSQLVCDSVALRRCVTLANPRVRSPPGLACPPRGARSHARGTGRARVGPEEPKSVPASPYSSSLPASHRPAGASSRPGGRATGPTSDRARRATPRFRCRFRR